MKKLIVITSVITVVLLGAIVLLALNERCNVAVLKLNGDLTTDTDGYIYDEESEESGTGVSSARIAEELGKLKDGNIRGLILDINSNGGSVVAADEIFEALGKLDFPKVAFVRDGAFSAAYIVASAADKIFLNKNSQVGAIGVTASYLEKYQKNLKEGIVFREFSSGKFKDLLNPNKPLSDEEKKLFQEIIDGMHENVVKTIAGGRKLNIEEVRKLADGSIFLAEKAIQQKLADKIGSFEDAKEYLKEKVGGEIKLCEAF